MKSSFSSTSNCWQRQRLAHDVVHTSHVRILFCNCSSSVRSHCFVNPSTTALHKFVSSFLVNRLRCSIDPMVPTDLSFQTVSTFLHRFTNSSIFQLFHLFPVRFLNWCVFEWLNNGGVVAMRQSHYQCQSVRLKSNSRDANV